MPFETWILPKVRQGWFGRVEPALLRPLAEMLKTVLLKLYAGLDNPDFNLTIDTLRHDAGDQEFFLWHMQILPRLTMPAGFELGSGMSINTVLPEEATSYLRDVAMRGHAHTYYAKQLTQQAIMEATELPILANEIVVS